MFSNIIAGAAGFPVADLGDEISQSLRFSGSQDFRRIVGTTSNRKTFTVSTWVKRGALGSTQMIWANGGLASGVFTAMRFQSTDKIVLQEYGGGPNNWIIETNALFRDTSAWYHLVLAVDTTQSTAADRVKFWVNGTQITDWGQSTYPSQNHNTYVNLSDGTGNESAPNPAVQVGIGVYHNGSSQRLNGYQAKTQFLDGITAVATNFGRYQEDGVWVPKNYTGSYGTNGYHLDYADSSDIGNDVSGNNNFTVSGFDTGDVRNYTQDLSSSGGFQASFPAKNAFDGQTVTTQAISSGGTDTITFAPDPPINFSTSISVFCSQTDNTASWDGNSWALPVANDWGTYSGSGTISASKPLTITSAGNGTTVDAIAIDGTSNILVDNIANDVNFLDTPTSNYATLNPLNEETAANTNQLLYEANLKSSNPAWGSTGGVFVNRRFDDNDNYYFEIYIGQRGNSANQQAYPHLYWKDDTNSHSSLANSTSHSYWVDGKFDWDAGDVLRVRTVSKTQFDVSKNGGTFKRVQFPMTDPYRFGIANSDSSVAYWNFGQMPFLYDVPNGYSVLQTNNLPEPTIKNSSDHFQTFLVTPGIEWTSIFNVGSATTSGLGTHTYQTSFTPATGGSNHDIIFKLSQRVTSVTFDFSQALNTSFWYPGWMVVDDIETATAWINKGAINTDSNGVITITDSNPFQYVKLRSLTNSTGTLTLESVNPGIDSILTTAQAAFPTGAWLIRARADEGNDAQASQWQWLDSTRGGTTAITFPFNTSGSSGNFMTTYDAPSSSSFAYCWDASSPETTGFQIIEDSSPTTGNNVISHNLGKTPEFIFSKETNNSSLGNIYHTSIGTSNGLTTRGDTEHTNAFRVTAVSSTQFTIASSNSSNPQIHYVWTSVPGFSQFGEYNIAESFVYTGFKPALLWIKKTGVAEGWWCADNKRNPANPVKIYTRLNSQGVETTSSGDRDVDFLSNGFRIRGTDSQISGSAQYVYMAWAEEPFGGENTAPATAR